jgi:choice-of-anchor B domain-containing protein
VAIYRYHFDLYSRCNIFSLSASNVVTSYEQAQIMKQIIAFSLLFLTFTSAGQLNVDSLGRLNYINLHLTMINDVWGYVDEAGNEYGLVGCEKGTSVVDLTDPTNPTEIFWEPGMESVWRDLKTWGDYAFVTTEAMNGLLIIDLSPLPASTTLPTTLYTGPVGNEWYSAHNLYIDENGYAYIFGSNRDNGGVIILDVNTDPMNPIEVGVFDDWYVHDGYVQNDTMYLAHISDGFMSIVDVTDKANPILLGTETTPSTFTHNIWATSNGQYAFTTDEVSGGYIGAFDVSDPTNIIEVDRIQSSPGAGVIPHNVHVLGDYVVTSYYSDGVTIHDATYPYNMVEVGNYDTYFDQTTGYDGCWGAYPYLPSGLILASDRSEGLFVLGPTYVQAAYLEGIVTDAVTLNPINIADIQITGSNQSEDTDNTGFYATGMASAGTYDVTYNKVGYSPQTISTTLTNGVITTQDVQLTPLPPYSLTVRVFDAVTSNPIDGVDIQLSVPLLTHTGLTNGLGEETLTLFYEDYYNLVVGKWGYISHCDYLSIDNTTGTIDVYLETGIYDDFTFDFGWSTSGNASTGMFVREEPFGTNSGSAPSADVITDCGTRAYVTGNANDLDPNLDDVDDGSVALTSPVMDLTGYADPYVNYSRWFHCFHGPFQPDDTLRVLVNNGTVMVEIDAVGSMHPDSVGWVQKSLRVSDYITLTNTMQFFFRTSDYEPEGNITEAVIDHFFIADSAILAIGDQSLKQELVVYPNPAQDRIFVNGIDETQPYVLLGMDGAVVSEGVLTKNNHEIEIENLSDGAYFLQLREHVFKVFKSN